MELFTTDGRLFGVFFSTKTTSRGPVIQIQLGSRSKLFTGPKLHTSISLVGTSFEQAYNRVVGLVASFHGIEGNSELVKEMTHTIHKFKEFYHLSTKPVTYDQVVELHPAKETK